MDRYQMLTDDTASLTPGVLDDTADEVYTNGSCWYLAWWLNKLTGYPVTVIGGYDPDAEPTADAPWSGFSWTHVGVTTPAGDFLDIRGPGNTDDAIEEWLHGEDVYTEEQGAWHVKEEDFLTVITFDPALVDDESARVTEATARAVCLEHTVPHQAQMA